MECQETRHYFADLLTESLPEDKAAGIDEHLASCLNCKSEFDAMRAMWARIDSKLLHIPNSKRMRARFYADLNHGVPTPSTPPARSHLRTGKLVLQAALLVALLTIGLFAAQQNRLFVRLQRAVGLQPAATETQRAPAGQTIQGLPSDQSSSNVAEAISTMLKGRLTSMQGEPVAGIRVIALETAYPRMNIVSQAETNKDGLYRLESVPAGEYFVVADPFHSPSYYPGAGNRDAAIPVTVGGGATTKDLDFKLVRISGILRAVRVPLQGAARFSGVLRNTQGNGLPNITVALSSAGSKARYWSVTNASGSFEFPELPAGELLMETFSPVQAAFEDLSVPITLRAGEGLQEEIGLRLLGNNQQRPDLYAPGDLKERMKEISDSPGGRVFWRCQNTDLQVQPEYRQYDRDANIKGSVSVQVHVDSGGNLVWLRIASRDANPDFARAAVEAVSHWTLRPLRLFHDEVSNRWLQNCDGEGEIIPFRGAITFNFPSD